MRQHSGDLNGVESVLLKVVGFQWEFEGWACRVAGGAPREKKGKNDAGGYNKRAVDSWPGAFFSSTVRAAVLVGQIEMGSISPFSHALPYVGLQVRVLNA